MSRDHVMTLNECVGEVHNILYGLNISLASNTDKYSMIAHTLNRALRANATEHEWSYYADTVTAGYAYAGMDSVNLSASVRPRILGDDAVRLVDREGAIHEWAYFLPRDALHKYRHERGLWVAITRDRLQFSRPLLDREHGLAIQVPVMREPRMFELGDLPTLNPGELVVNEATLRQELDFPYADVVIYRACMMIAQTDPLLQPRVQTLEDQMKSLMFQLIERDTYVTDSPYINDFVLPISGDVNHVPGRHRHPHTSDREV